MSPLMQINFWLVVVNVILLVYLAIFHIFMIRDVRSSFTMGLLLFVFAFLIHNILAAFFYLTMRDLYAPGTELLVLIITSIETIAFIIFAWITRR